MNIYVGNLAFGVTDEDLRELFAAYGDVESASVVKDRFSGESRGFGFVEMPARNDAMEAITALNGKDVNGRSIIVNEAKPKAPKGGGGGGGGRGGYGGGGGRGDRGDRGGRRY
jgi:cold-inducible RNA-binding protein